jgi:hypothetical protein
MARLAVVLSALALAGVVGLGFSHTNRIIELEERVRSAQHNAQSAAEDLQLVYECLPEMKDAVYTVADAVSSLAYDGSSGVGPYPQVSRYCQRILFGDDTGGDF